MINFEMIQTGSLPDFNVLAKQFPELSARIMGYIGHKASIVLYDEYLSGQSLNYRPAGFSPSGVPLSSRGRRMVAYSISKDAKRATLTSFPLNFFEQGRLLRSGRREPAKRILTGSFSARISSQLGELANEGADIIFNDWAEKNGGDKQL
jgi:hypothetical protein